MPPNAAERIYPLLSVGLDYTTKDLMHQYNSQSVTGHKLNYEQVNKALNLLVRQGRVLKNLVHGCRVVYYKAEEY
jgi:hypothetical protein